MIGVFANQEEGQALVIAGLAMAVLMGALVLSVDWGYRLATQRAVQNQVDAAVFAAARALVTTYDGGDFDTTQESVWVAACNARNANGVGGPAGSTLSLIVSFLDIADDSRAPLAQVGSSSASCALAGATTVSANTAFVRVEASARFPSLFDTVTRQPLVAAASARVQLTAGAAVRQLRLPPVLNGGGDIPVGPPGVGASGASTAPNAAIWPIVLRYASSVWAPSAPSRRLTLMNNGSLPTGTSFVTLAHFSPREAMAGRTAHQLVTESDYTGHDNGSPQPEHGHQRTPRLMNSAPVSALCPGLWDTGGTATFSGAGACDVPNWFNYGYRGSLSVSTNWADPGWAAFEAYLAPGAELPDPFPAGPRASCAYPYLRRPYSCSPENSAIGDWVETVPASAVDANVVAARMVSFINQYGRDVPDGTGGQVKAAVVNIFLWDCSEWFGSDPAFPGERWLLNASGGDCSLATPAPGRQADRVHFIAAVPVTISLNDIQTSLGQPTVSATWGGVFSDAGACAPVPNPSSPSACALNALTNSAFLVPDEP